MGKLRVAFFAEILIEDNDGATRTMFQLIKRIPHDRFDYLFICGVGPQHIGGFNVLRIPALTLPINVNYKMAVPALAQRILKETLDEFAPDVIHIATPSLLGSYAIDYARKQQLPVLTIYHTHFISYIAYYLKHLPFLIGPVKRQIVKGQRAFYNNCDKVYVPAESIGAELVEMGIQPSRIQIWKRGIDRSLFHPDKRNRAWLQRKTGNTYPTVLFASRLVWEKNLEILFAIYDRLRKSGVKHNLVIAGDGLAADSCRQRMPAAIFLGKVDHESLSVLYASSDVFLFPSVSETYGNVVIEAMASGLPCVIADGGGSRDFITPGQNGYRCLPFDAGDFTSKVLSLLVDNETARQFSEACLKQSARYHWEQLADIYFADLEDLAEPAGTRKKVLIAS